MTLFEKIACGINSVSSFAEKISTRTHLCLFLKSLPLDDRVVQLSVGVAQLLGQAEHLKAFGDAGLGAMPFGQGAHDFGVVDDEGGVDA